MSPEHPPSPAHRPNLIERALEGVLFASRWVLAPVYVGLAAAQLLLLVSFCRKAYSLVTRALEAGSDEVIIGVLSLIDLSLMSNLLLMVILSGYESFVSRIDGAAHRDRPDWLDHVGFGELKLKLMTSIVAISAIHVLEDFMHADQLSDRALGWSVGIHLVFVLSGLLLALMDRVAGRKE